MGVPVLNVAAPRFSTTDTISGNVPGDDPAIVFGGGGPTDPFDSRGEDDAVIELLDVSVRGACDVMLYHQHREAKGGIIEGGTPSSSNKCMLQPFPTRTSQWGVRKFPHLDVSAFKDIHLSTGKEGVKSGALISWDGIITLFGEKRDPEKWDSYVVQAANLGTSIMRVTWYWREIQPGL